MGLLTDINIAHFYSQISLPLGRNQNNPLLNEWLVRERKMLFLKSHWLAARPESISEALCCFYFLGCLKVAFGNFPDLGCVCAFA